MQPTDATSQTEVRPSAEYLSNALGAPRCVPKLTSRSNRSAGLTVLPEHLETLRRWARSRTLPARLVLRARVVLSLAAGWDVAVAASRLHTTPATIRLWRHRYATEGLESLTRDRAGRGRKPLPIRDAVIGAESRAGGPVRSEAKSLGVSPSTISRWRRARRDRQGS